MVKLSEFEQNLGNTRVHNALNALIVKHSGYLVDSPIRLNLTIPSQKDLGYLIKGSGQEMALSPLPNVRSTNPS